MRNDIANLPGREAARNGGQRPSGEHDVRQDPNCRRAVCSQRRSASSKLAVLAAAMVSRERLRKREGRTRPDGYHHPAHAKRPRLRAPCTAFVLFMPDVPIPPDHPLVPIGPRDAVELIAMALSLAKGRVRQADIAREATARSPIGCSSTSRLAGSSSCGRHRRLLTATTQILIAQRLRGRKKKTGVGAMPDGPREPFRPTVRIEPCRSEPEGFTATNTSGVDHRELIALDRALRRLMDAGLTEREAKLAIDAAVRQGLEPKDAGEADVDRLLAWR